MVIISAVVCDKLGALILARQFQSISSLQLKETIRNFPKMISPTQQHTFIDYENMRFIYTPLDQLYLLLLTTKNSNIIEDLEVLRILNRVISEICISITPENVKSNNFEILLAIDDVITSGIRECTTVTQVRSALEMESSEEKLHLMLMRARENEAKEISKKHQIEIERKRKEEALQKKKAPNSPSSINQNAFSPSPPDPFSVESEKKDQLTSFSQISNTKTEKVSQKKGMQLGKKKQQISDNLFEQE